MSERSSVCNIRSMLQRKKCVWLVTGHFIAEIETECSDLKMLKSLL